MIIFEIITLKRITMNMPVIESKRKLKRLKITANVLVILLFIFMSLALVPKIIGDISKNGISTFYDETWQVMVMYWTYIVFAIGVAIVWKHKLIGSIIILLASLLQMLPFLIIDLNFGSLIFGLPMFVSGLLFYIISRRLK